MDFWTYEYMNIIPFAPVSGLPQGGGGGGDQGYPLGLTKNFSPRVGSWIFGPPIDWHHFVF